MPNRGEMLQYPSPHHNMQLVRKSYPQGRPSEKEGENAAVPGGSSGGKDVQKEGKMNNLEKGNTKRDYSFY